MTFKWYLKNVYGEEKKYPADQWSKDALVCVGGNLCVTPFQEKCLKFFGVEMEQVLPPSKR
jgi:hypothetical protein